MLILCQQLNTEAWYSAARAALSVRLAKEKAGKQVMRFRKFL